jgi:hypothetical protein
MADNRVLTSSVSFLHNNLYNWDLTEILRYKEANSFTYVGNRIKWIDTFDMLKLFTKNAIGQAGKWLSPGGKYKKFVSSNSDLTITWNYELGMLTFKGSVGDNLKELFANIMNEDRLTNSISFKIGSSNKDKLLHIGEIVSEAGGKVIDRDSAESECEAVTHTTDISTLEELQEIVDRSYQGMLPRNGNVNVSFAQTIDSSTPFRSRAAECLSMEERFCTFKVNIESTVTALKAKLSEQTQIIAENKQELCKLASDNLHLRTRLAELEEKVYPKDKSTILNSPSRNGDIPNNTSVNKSQPIAPNKDNNPKEGPLPVATQNIQPNEKSARKFSVRTSGPLTDKRGYHQVHAQYQSQSMSNRNSNRYQHGKRTKASVQCPFLKRNGRCLKGSRCDFSHNYVLPTICEPKFRQNPIQRAPSFNIPQPDCYQVPFPFNPNYFPPIQHPIFQPFPYLYPSPLIPPLRPSTR